MKEFVMFAVANWQMILGALVALILALAALCLAAAYLFTFIPGEQPEKALYAIGNKLNDWGKKIEPYSKKPSQVVAKPADPANPESPEGK